MQLELTVESPSGERDVVITAPEQAPLVDVLSAIRRVTGLSDDQPLWAGTRELDPRAPLSSVGLRSGDVLRSMTPVREAPDEALRTVRVVGGPDSGMTVPLRSGRMHIGRSTGCDVQLTDPAVSRRHAIVDVGTHGITVHDTGSANGTWIGNRRIAASPLPAAATIRVGDSLITVDQPVTAPAATRPGPDGTVLVSRPPGGPRSWPMPEIDLPQREPRQRPRGIQWIAAALPAGAGALLAWVWGVPQFLLFALLSPAMMITTAVGDRWHWRRSRRRAFEDFRERKGRAARELHDALRHETRLRRTAAPDPVELLQVATLPGSRLWERHRDQDDFLRMRLATGSVPSTTRVRRGSDTGSAGPLQDVPVCVDLRQGPLGVGIPAGQRAGLARWLVAQIASLHSPDDVELALLLPAADPVWTWARWLPHLRGRVGWDSLSRNLLVDDLVRWVDQRLSTQRRDGTRWTGPWLVLVVDRVAHLTDGLTDLLTRGINVGLTAICLEDGTSHLPANCASLVVPHGDSGTRVRTTGPDLSEASNAVVDQVSGRWAATVARALAPTVDAGRTSESALPNSCGLLPLLDRPDLRASGIEERWAASTGTARTTLGLTAEGPLTLDLVYDGPHVLIAGTTGAGKSELLRTLIAGLAVEQPPDEMNFLLIDYKGGAAFAECAELPHTAGLVTDLDPYLTERVLRSLRAEIRRRERLLADAGADDLSTYRATAPQESLPRLVIAVDEFAALAAELPTFVTGLVAVAQRGRSLGLHLVLATQRPGQVVSPEILANTELRVCLRVTDPAESQNVLDAAEAAFLERRAPGRGYLRHGSSLTAFQTAYASGSTPPNPREVTVEEVGPWRRRHRPPSGTHSDLAVLTGLIRRTCADTRYRSGPPPWRPPVPEHLPQDVLPAVGPSSVAFGLVDQPDEQRQLPLTIDLARASSLLIVGSSGSGRSTALAAAALGAVNQLPPDELTLYVIDAHRGLVSALNRLPHSATTLDRDDLALAPHLLRRLADGEPRSRAPALLLIDDWPSILEGLDEPTAAECSAALATLLRVSASIGLTTIATGDRSLLLPRFAASFDERILLRLTERSDYALAGLTAKDVPGRLPPGRGVRASDRTLIQIADPGPADEAVSRAEARWARTPYPAHPDAIHVRPLPTDVRLGELPRQPGRFTLGLGGDMSEPITLAPFEDATRLLVAGPPRSGRTSLLRILLTQAVALGVPVLVAATNRSELAADARRAHLPCLAPGDDELDASPRQPTLLLVDDCEAYVDTPIGEQLTAWLRSADTGLLAAVAGRTDDLALSYRGLGTEARRHHCGVLLRPGPLDGELLGVRLPRRPRTRIPGRGIVVGPPSWGAPLTDGEPTAIQVARL